MSGAPVKALVLCGGESRRMGSDKAQLQWGEQTLLARALDAVGQVVPEVWISLARDGPAPAESSRVIRDLGPRIGPLGGIHAAQRSDPNVAWLVLAVDLPKVQPALLQALLASRQAGTQVILATGAGGPQPLCAVYEPETAPLVQAAIDNGRHALHQLLRAMVVRSVPVCEDRLLNLNRAEDFRQAQDGPQSSESRSSLSPK